MELVPGIVCTFPTINAVTGLTIGTFLPMLWRDIRKHNDCLRGDSMNGAARIACPHCGRNNMPGQGPSCWSCGKPLSMTAQPVAPVRPPIISTAPRKPLTPTQWVLAVVVGLVLLCGFGSLFQPKSLTLGDVGRLTAYEGRENVLVAVTKEARESLTHSLVAKDEEGGRQLAGAGLLFIVPANTQVRIIDRDMGVWQIRVLEGSSQGQSGWVLREQVTAIP